MAQSVAHTSRVGPVVNVPVTVIYRTTPCTWKLRENRRVTIWEHGRLIHPVRFYEGDAHSVPSKQFNAWAVREHFLALKTEQDFLEFLTQVGHFSACSAKRSRGRWGTDALVCWQKVFIQLLKRPPEKWDAYMQKVRVRGFDTRLIMMALNEASEFNIKFRWKARKHAAALTAFDIVTAIFATIYIDRLSGAKFGFCARSDCGRPFEMTRRDKQYCKTACAHLEGVRRLRKRRSREKLKGKRRRRLDASPPSRSRIT